MSQQRYNTVFNVKPSFILNWLASKGYGGKTLTEGFMAYLATKNGLGSTITECLNACLTNLGYTGTLDDKLRAFYCAKTGISHPKDAEMAFYQSGGDFTALGPGGIDAYTKLMLHMDDTGLTDSELAPTKTVTKNGDVARSSTQSKFGGYSAVFDGTGDYLSIGNSSDFNPGSSDWTHEGWVYPTTIAGDVRHLFARDGSTSGFSQYFIRINTDGTLTARCYDNSGNLLAQIVSVGSISVNNWYHLALVRSGTTLNLHQNGTIVGTTTINGSIGSPSTPLLIGKAGTGNGYFIGYIDEYRWSNGIARWTSNFTPETQAYST